MKMRLALAARLIAPPKDERAIETDPLEEIEADLRMLGIDPTTSVAEARRLALGGRPTATNAVAGAAAVSPAHIGAPARRARRQQDWLSPTVVVGLLRLSDAVIVLLAALVAWVTRFDGKELVIEPYLSVLAVLLTINVFQFADLYNFDRLTNPISQLRQLVLAWMTVLAGLLVVGFMTKMTITIAPLQLERSVLHWTSRIWVGLWFSYSLFGLILARLVLTWQIHRWQAAGRLTRHIVVVGAGAHGQQLIEQMLKDGDGGVRIVGIFDDRGPGRVPAAICGLPVLGSVQDLVGFAHRNSIDQIIVALPWHAGARMLDWLQALRGLPVDVSFCPRVGAGYLPQGPITEVAGVPMLNVIEKPLSGWNYIVKSVEDRLVAAAILLMLLPVFLLIALLIKLESRGPVLVRQKRRGFNNEVLEVYQFRTAYLDQRADRQTGHAAAGDPRTTSFGRILRRSSLDQLPQFINVLMGTMSAVGPAPHAVVRG
jgi:CoA-binding domain/Bacterial sugar transferase